MIDPGGVAAVAGMYGAFLAVGFLAARKVRDSALGTASPENLIVAGRAMPLWVATLTMCATWVDGGYLLGTAEYTYKHGLAHGLQGGICFGLSLLVGGLFFAAPMRRRAHHTMVDAFADRYGHAWAAVLFLPAMLGEVFWSAALLVAIGSTLGYLLGVDLVTAILVSAAVVLLYTTLGGMWSVAYADMLQFALIPIGMLVALPFAIERAGGLPEILRVYVLELGAPAAAPIAPLPRLPAPPVDSYWNLPAIVSYWDMAIMLVLGGVPWNCYFQRVLSCETPAKARWHSIFAGLLTIALTAPPALLGMVALATRGAGGIDPASFALPRVLGDLPYPVKLLGIAAIVGAVSSSLSSSTLSAGVMYAWNVHRPLLAPDAPPRRIARVVRASVLALGVASVVLALSVRSVAALWLFTGDLVFVLLFPQLAIALFDPKATRAGSIAGFVVALALRLSGGVSLETDAGAIGFAAWLPWSDWLAGPGSPLGPSNSWNDSVGATYLPIRTFAALSGAVVALAVSRIARRIRVPGRVEEPRLSRNPGSGIN